MKKIFRLQKMSVYNKDLDMNLESAGSESEPLIACHSDELDITVFTQKYSL
jgi:hypothetical protein